MRRFFACAATLALITAPAAAQDFITLSPAQIGEIFCLSRLGNDMAPAETLLTEDLKLAIAEADARNAEYEKAHPGDKPPLGDGIPWQSWQDYADQCAVTPGKDNSVAIAYGFTNQPSANFTDTLTLSQVDDPAIGARRWRIDNISYSTGGNLRRALAAAFAE